MNDQDQLILEHLSQFISDHKKDFVERVLNARTRQVTIVMEDIFQSQNASAVIRTCECMGIQDVHIVENITKYSINPRVLKGADKWIDLHRHASKQVNNTEAAFQQLHAEGYKIVVADPDADNKAIHDLEGSGKLAIVFGNELRGVSRTALSLCDEKVRIPMYGFTESLNISVSVAICLSTVIAKLHATNRLSGLTEEEKAALRMKWYRKIVRKSDLIVREFVRAIE
jgi:tRNA (guanosine-2'-O-)-methyltransferase